MAPTRDPVPNDDSHSGEERLYAALRVYFEANDSEQRKRLLEQHPELASELEPLVTSDVPVSTPAEIAAALPEAALLEPSPGTRIGDFRLLRRLGEGGMGVVFEAEQVSLRRRVALKVLLGGGSANARRKARFRREAEAGGRVQHKNIVAVYTVGEENGVPFIAQELIDEGRSLADWIDDRTATVGKAGHDEAWERRIAEFFAQAAFAVQAAHDAGVLHRDLKPRNLLVTPDGEPKIADFGLAFMRASLEISQSGDQIGTPNYMSPEQIDPSLGEVDERSDVFSLGAALYEALVLEKPFDAPAHPAIFTAILSDTPVDPRRAQPELSRDLAAICQKALERRPVRRYATMRALAEDLERFLDGAPTTARPATFLDTARRLVVRNRVGLVAGLLIGCAVGYAIKSQRELGRTQQQKDVAIATTLKLRERALFDPDLLRSDDRFASEVTEARTWLDNELASEPRFAADLLQRIALAAIVRERRPDDRALALSSLEDAARRLDSVDRVAGALCALRAARLAEVAGSRDIARRTREEWLDRLKRDGREEARWIRSVFVALEVLADWQQGRFDEAEAHRKRMRTEADSLLALDPSRRVRIVAREVAADLYLAISDHSSAASVLGQLRQERAESGNQSTGDVFEPLDDLDELSLRALALAHSGDVERADRGIDRSIADRERVFVDGSPGAIRDRLRAAEIELLQGNVIGLSQSVEQNLELLEGLGRRLSEDALRAERLLVDIRMVAAKGGSQQNRAYQLGLAAQDLERAIATARAVRGERHPEVEALTAKLAQVRELAAKESN